jgi:RNA polymerase sigma factor (sigma-70 family)
MSTAHPADEEDSYIIRRMAAGHAEGIEALLRKYGPRIKGALRSLAGAKSDDHALEDAVHDAALIMFRKARRLDPERNLAGFMYMTARRALTKAWSLSALDKQLWDGAETEIADHPREAEPSHNGVAERVAILLEQLPRREKEILAYDRASDFSVAAAEVARALGTTPATVYALRNRTKERLAALLPHLNHGGSSSNGRDGGTR